MEHQTKVETGAGVFMGVFIFTLMVLGFFTVSPISFYYSQWNNYWWSEQSQSQPSTNINFNYDPSLLDAAYDDCNSKGIKLYGADGLSTYASSTDAKTPFKTYDCYYLKHKKLGVIE